MLQDILKEFEELCEKQGFGISYEFDLQDYNDSINNLKDFITNTYNTARKELVEEILDEIPEAGGIEVTNNAGEKTLMFNGFIDRQEIITLLNKKI